MTKQWKGGLLLGGVWFAVMVSSIAVVVSSHHNRQLFGEYIELQRQEHRLQVDWGRYLLERSAWAELGRVEKLAVDDLNMHVPSFEEVVVVP